LVDILKPPVGHLLPRDDSPQRTMA
jgi:hypothetical protein